MGGGETAVFGVVVLLCCRVVARPSGLSPLQLRESGEGGARTACVICFLRLPERNDASLSLARLIIEHLPYFVLGVVVFCLFLGRPAADYSWLRFPRRSETKQEKKLLRPRQSVKKH